MRISNILGLTSFLSFMAVTIPAHAFDRNISGVWDDPHNTRFVVGQYKDEMSFSTTINTDSTGRVTLTFSGTFSSLGKDKFMFGNEGNSFTAVVKGKTCTVRSIFATTGVVVGEAPGRRIHMSDCGVTLVSPNCAIGGTYVCDGVWK